MDSSGRAAAAPEPKGRRARDVRRASWLVGLVAVAVFANSLWNGFAYDDLYIIQENEAIHGLERLPEALAAPYWPGDLGPAFGLWRPVSTGLFGLEWWLWGNDPAPFHGANVLLHAAASVLTLRLLLLLLPFWGAVAGALLFAVHPVHVEAVANVVGLAEVFSAVLYLTACLAFCRWREALNAPRVGALGALYALAFLAKESAVTLPGALFLLDNLFEDRGIGSVRTYLGRRWHLYAALGAVASLVLLGRYAVLGHVAQPLGPFGADILQEIPRIWTVAASWPHYFRLLLFPVDLSIDYSPGVIPVRYGWSAAGVLGVVLVLATLGVALWSWRAPPPRPRAPSPRAVGFGIVWFVVTIAPTANVVFLSGILMAERILYLPSLGLVAVVGWVVSNLHVERPRVAATFVASALVLLSARTVSRNPVWRDTASAFESLRRDHPESARVPWAMGDALLEAGRVSEALRAYRTAIRYAGTHYSLNTEIGRRLIQLGRPGSAVRLLETARENRPELMLAPSLLLNAYQALEAWPETESVARGVLVHDPDNAPVLHVLAGALRSQGRWPEAAEARRATIAAGEGRHWQQWYWLAEEEARSGRPAASAAALDSARIRATGADSALRVDSLAAWLEGR